MAKVIKNNSPYKALWKGHFVRPFNWISTFVNQTRERLKTKGLVVSKVRLLRTNLDK